MTERFQATPGLSEPEGTVTLGPARIGGFQPPPAGGAQRLTEEESFQHRFTAGHLTTEEEERRLAKEEEARQAANLQRTLREHRPLYEQTHETPNHQKLANDYARWGGILTHDQEREITTYAMRSMEAQRSRDIPDLLIERTLYDSPQVTATAARLSREYKVPYDIALTKTRELMLEEDKRVMHELFQAGTKLTQLFKARPELFGAAREDVPLLIGLERSFDDFRQRTAAGAAGFLRQNPGLTALAPDAGERWLEVFDDIAKSDPKQREWWGQVHEFMSGRFRDSVPIFGRGLVDNAPEWMKQSAGQIVADPAFAGLGMIFGGLANTSETIGREVARLQHLAQGLEFDGSEFERSEFTKFLRRAQEGGQEIADSILPQAARTNPQLAQDLTGAIGELGWQGALGAWMLKAAAGGGKVTPMAMGISVGFNAFYNYMQSSYIATELARELLPEGADPIRADVVGAAAGLTSSLLRPWVIFGRIIHPGVAPGLLPSVNRLVRPDLTQSAAVRKRLLDTFAAGASEFVHEAATGLQTDLAMRAFVDPTSSFRIAEVTRGATLAGAAAAILREFVGFGRRSALVQAAGPEAARVQAMYKAVEGMQLAENDPVSLRDIVDVLADSQEGEAPTELFIDSRMLGQVLQAAGLNPNIISAELPSVRDQADLLPIGGVLAVNTAELLAFGARHKISNQLALHTQTRPDLPSYAEMRVIMDEQKNVMQEVATKLRGTVADAAQWDAELDAIRSDLTAQISAREGASWLTPTVAAGYADMVTSFYNAMAAQLKVTPGQVQQIMAPTIENLTANARSWAGELSPRVFGELNGRVMSVLAETRALTQRSQFDALTPGEAMQTMLSLAPAAAPALEARGAWEGRVSAAAARSGALVQPRGLVPLQQVVTELLNADPDGPILPGRVAAWARSTAVAQTRAEATALVEALQAEFGQGEINVRPDRVVLRVPMTDAENAPMAEIEVVTPSVFLADEGPGQALKDRLEHLPEGEARDAVQQTYDELYNQAVGVDSAPSSVDSVWSYLSAMREADGNPVIHPTRAAVQRQDGTLVQYDAAGPAVSTPFQIDPNSPLGQPLLPVTEVRDWSMAYIRDYLSPDEAADLTNSLAENIVRSLENIMSAREFAAVAFAGRAKRGWYAETARVLHATFGADAPRFAALLAALSPQTSVESNLLNALNTWVNWQEAGGSKITDHARILEILAQSVERPDKGQDSLAQLRNKIDRVFGPGTAEGKSRVELENLADSVPDAQWIQLSVLDAWGNNVIRALTKDAVGVLRTLSGPKVDSFHLNVLGDTLQGTGDTFMAQFAGILQKMLSGRKTTTAVDEIGQIGIKSGPYIALNVRMRQAAQLLTEITGEQWTIPEVQETIWSWVKTLQDLSRSEARRQTGRTGVDIYKAGEITHALVKGTVDFASLFNDPRYAAILQRGGYGAKIRDLARGDRFLAESAESEATRLEAEESALDPGTRQSFRAFELKTAQRLADFEAAGDDAGRVQWAGDVAKHAGRHQLNHSRVPVQTAKLSDFGPRGIKNILQRDNWAIVTAENPMAQTLTPEENAARQVILKAELDAAGYQYLETEGKYTDADNPAEAPLEHPFIVIGISEAEALDIARRHNQDAVLTRRGLVYQDGTFSPAEGDRPNVMKTAPDNYYTRIPKTGVVFSIDMDFGRYVRPEHATHPVDNMYAFEWTQASGDAPGKPTGFEATPADSRARKAPKAPSGNAETNISQYRKDVASGKIMQGDGRGFTDFFATTATGKKSKWVPKRRVMRAIPLGSRSEKFAKARRKHMGSFDAHIGASIPGFNDVQAVVGAAILAAYQEKGARVLDIGTSEGAMIKALAAESGGRIQSIGVDPNPVMAQVFANLGDVPGATYSVTAFANKKDAGKKLWTEDPRGTLYDAKGEVIDENVKRPEALEEGQRWEQTIDAVDIYGFDPGKEKFDVIHEAMVFQFIDNGRNAQIRRVKEMLAQDGIAIFEQKFADMKDRYDAAEAKKDAEWKALHFTPAQIEAKRQEVLARGGDEVEGMTALQVAWWEMEDVLRRNFNYVIQFWESGNFRGYAASNDRRALQRLMNNMQTTDTRFANQNTPRLVAQPQDVFYQMAGLNARTADVHQQNKAREMESFGFDADAIWEKTSWMRGKDGAWRFVISDGEMITQTTNELSAAAGRGVEIYDAIQRGDLDTLQHYAMPLGSLVFHDKLFAAYPQLLATFDVVLAELPYASSRPSIGVTYQPQDGKKGLLVAIGRARTDEMNETLVHELQHAVQHIEGFAPGTSPTMAGIRLLGFDSIEAYNTRLKELVALDEQQQRAYYDLGDMVAKIIKRRLQDWHRRNKDTYPAAHLASAPGEVRLAIQQRVVAKYGDPQAAREAWYATKAELQRIQTLPKGAFETYQAWGGEAESRMVEAMYRDALHTLRFGPAADSDPPRAPWQFYDMPLDKIIVEWNGQKISSFDPELNESRGPLPATVRINGVERPSTNNKGRPIYPTEEGIRKFWEWFGDSKAVDARGRPIVFYHGTEADFAEFRQSAEGMLGAGMYFTSVPSEAESFAGETGSIMPVYLQVLRPISKKELNYIIDDIEAKDLGNEAAGEEIRDTIIGQGYDGALPTHGEETLALVFEPTQIKSSIGNDGTFDPANPDIRSATDNYGPIPANAAFGGLSGEGQMTAPPPPPPSEGIHFSNAPRYRLDGRYHGTGYRGAERRRTQFADDTRLQSRVHLYLDEGHGVTPEPGVGAIMHVVSLTSYRLYNPNLDTERLWTHQNPNDNESAVLDAGYDGYWVPGAFGNQGAVVLLGDAAHDVGADPMPPGRDPMLRADVRGAFDPSRLTIQLLENADFSTFLHETGHMFLHMMTEFAGNPDAPASLRDDVQRLMEWMGVPDLITWRNMSLDQQRPYHEKFAENWEVWLFEGQSPAPELRPLFRMFKQHMTEVYGGLDQKVKASGSQLTDEVRAIMGRMLSAEAQVRDRAAELGIEPLFRSEDEAGLTHEQWLRYQAEHEDIINSAIDQQTQRALRNVQWLDNARSKYVAKLQAKAKALRREARAEVEEEMREEPVWAVQTWLRTGRLPDGTQTEGTRLSSQALREMYGDGAAAAWRYLPGGLIGDGGTAEGFMHPDMVSEMFGFQSGDAMVRELIQAGKRDVELDARTDQRMLERHGDLATEEGMREAASLAVHSQARARFLASELKSLEEAMQMRGQGRTQTGKPRSVNVLVEAARQYAQAQIDRTRVSALHPRQFEAASRKAGKEAERALRAGDLAGAARAKREQMVHHFMAQSALKAREEMAKARDYMAKFDKDAVRKRIPPDYMEQIDAILERLDLRKSTTQRQIQRRQSLKAWYDQQLDDGTEPLIDPALLEDAGLVSYKQMTVEQLREVIDGIKNIEHIGRLKDRLLTAQDKRRFNAIIEDLVANIREKRVRDYEIPVDRNTKLDRVLGAFREIGAMHRKLTSYARQLDGGVDGGPMWELLIRPLNAAMDEGAQMRANATRELTEMFKPFLQAKGYLNRKVHIPEINASLTREARLAIVLNMGNETNMQRLMGGDGWNQQQLQAIAATLTADELRMIGEIWSWLDRTYWNKIAEKEKRVTGVVPQKVEGQLVELMSSDGETVSLQGNYYPIKYDVYRSQRSAAMEADQVQQQMRQGLFTRTTTRRGHTKQRVAEVNRPVRKDIGVLMEHVEQVIHDLTLHEYLIDANRILNDKRMEQALKETIRTEGYQAMLNTVRDVAVGVIPAVNAWESFLNHIRAGVSIAGMGWNIMTALVQPLGLTQSIARVGPKYMALGMGHWVGDAVRMENTLAAVQAKSKFMRDRGRTLQREVAEIRNRVSGERSAFRTAAEASYFWLMLRVQYVADLPTWQGAYLKAIDSGFDEAKAVALADQTVRDTQGSGLLADMSGIQRGGPLLKLWTNFYNFFNTTYNMLAEDVHRTTLKDPLSIGKLAADVFLFIVLPSFLSTLLYGLQEEEPFEDLPEKLIRDQVTYLMGTVVGVRDLSGIVSGFDYKGPAGLRFYSAIEKAARQAMRDEINPESLAAASVSAGGILFHLPATQMNRIWQGTLAVMEEGAPMQSMLLGPPRE